MSLFEAYVLTCDHCGQSLIYDADGYVPQSALDDATTVKGWTAYLTQAHCVDCPPLCTRCGFVLTLKQCQMCGDDGQG